MEENSEKIEFNVGDVVWTNVHGEIRPCRIKQITTRWRGVKFFHVESIEGEKFEFELIGKLSRTKEEEISKNQNYTKD